MKKKHRGEPGYAFLLPSLAGVSIFVLIPFLDVVRRSFTTAMGGRFVGLQNYSSVIGNVAFRLALTNTLRFLLCCIPLLLGLSLLLALILHAIGEQAGIWRTTFLLPMAITMASVAFLWQVLFDRSGLINGAFVAMGGDPVNWMHTPRAFWVMVGTFIWKNLGYNMILWLAGLGGINPSLFDAAKVDGAGPIRTFIYVTLPCLSPSLYTIMVLSLINAFKVFREAYLVAGDYPHNSIYLLQHLFGNWFRELSMDKLAAAAVIVALGIMLLIVLLRRAWDKT